MGSLFGGSKQKSTSSNQAYGQLSEAFSPVLGSTQTGTNALMALLGLGGDSGAASNAMNNYMDSAGYNFMLDSGSRAITGNKAAAGLLRSGSTGKALTNFGQQLGSQYFNNYLDRILEVANLGLGAGQLLAGAGNVSKSSGKSKNGLGGLVGGISSGIAASDRRLKKDVKKLRTLENGLNVYEYMYINDTGPYIGVMADEVEKFFPEALGPVIDGYKTVDYSKIKGL